MRYAQVKRKTTETDIDLSLNLDRRGETSVSTGCAFLDHMLELFAHHAGFSLSVCCKGDVEVDFHHTVEDVGICLGTALSRALSEKRGIKRYGSIILPMDEALLLCAVDISGRGTLCLSLDGMAQKVGEFDTELVSEFFLAVIRNCPITLHIKKLDGVNTHHIIEGAFKAFARALSQAVSIDEKNSDGIASTKGVL